MVGSAARRPRRRAFRPSDAVDYDRHADSGTEPVLDDRMVIFEDRDEDDEALKERDLEFYLEQKPPHH